MIFRYLHNLLPNLLIDFVFVQFMYWLFPCIDRDIFYQTQNVCIFFRFTFRLKTLQRANNEQNSGQREEVQTD